MHIHYIIVRRDLPLGVLAAMVTHAAGESAAAYQYAQVEPQWKGSTAVVLEAHNEIDLGNCRDDLKAAGVELIEVHESSGPYMGQFMAIGVLPGDREKLSPNFVEYECLKA